MSRKPWHNNKPKFDEYGNRIVYITDRNEKNRFNQFNQRNQRNAAVYSNKRPLQLTRDADGNYVQILTPEECLIKSRNDNYVKIIPKEALVNQQFRKGILKSTGGNVLIDTNYHTKGGRIYKDTATDAEISNVDVGTQLDEEVDTGALEHGNAIRIAKSRNINAPRRTGRSLANTGRLRTDDDDDLFRYKRQSPLDQGDKLTTEELLTGRKCDPRQRCTPFKKCSRHGIENIIKIGAAPDYLSQFALGLTNDGRNYLRGPLGLQNPTIFTGGYDPLYQNLQQTLATLNNTTNLNNVGNYSLLNLASNPLVSPLISALNKGVTTASGMNALVADIDKPTNTTSNLGALGNLGNLQGLQALANLNILQQAYGQSIAQQLSQLGLGGTGQLGGLKEAPLTRGGYVSCDPSELSNRYKYRDFGGTRFVSFNVNGKWQWIPAQNLGAGGLRDTLGLGGLAGLNLGNNLDLSTVLGLSGLGLGGLGCNNYTRRF